MTRVYYSVFGSHSPSARRTSVVSPIVIVVPGP